MFTLIIELLGTAAFCISGVIVAQKNNMDGIGVIVLAAVTAVGGGTIRDVVLNMEVFWLSDTKYIYIILLSSIIGIIWLNLVKKIPAKTLELFDALGLALFALTGMIKALNAGFTNEASILMGLITGCFGGVIRDVLANEIPLIFQKELYAFCALFGCIVYLAILSAGLSDIWSFYIAFCSILLLRFLAIKYQLRIPVFRN